jgi:hypothetical protein
MTMLIFKLLVLLAIIIIVIYNIASKTEPG